ncbi:MAG: 4'-phosphopantetheinyl transferase superfamily protein [Pseudomonadota bacterium]|nr:4'-phosphopantetheinyl transferase superfamily protein [Pseudomonadota bacterium]
MKVIDGANILETQGRLVTVTAFTTLALQDANASPIIAIWATAQDHAQAKQRKSPAAQRSVLLTRGTLRALLYRLTGDLCWTLTADASGKLQAVKESGDIGPFISLSHTPDFIACAVSPHSAVGIDIERWRERDYSAIASYVFSPLEQADVTREGPATFFRIWTMREALGKATGHGLFAQIDGQNDEFVNWEMFYRVQDSCSLSIACQKTSTAARISYQEIAPQLLTHIPAKEAGSVGRDPALFLCDDTRARGMG